MKKLRNFDILWAYNMATSIIKGMRLCFDRYNFLNREVCAYFYKLRRLKYARD